MLQNVLSWVNLSSEEKKILWLKKEDQLSMGAPFFILDDVFIIIIVWPWWIFFLLYLEKLKFMIFYSHFPLQIVFPLKWNSTIEMEVRSHNSILDWSHPCKGLIFFTGKSHLLKFTLNVFTSGPKRALLSQFSLSPIRKKYLDVTFPGAMWDRAVATSFPARERGWPVKRARTCTCIGLRLSLCWSHNGSLAKTTHWTTDHN